VLRRPRPCRWLRATPVKPTLNATCLVLGAGPGGYSAAFRSADLGMTTVLVERYPTLAASASMSLHPLQGAAAYASVMDEVKQMAHHGISYSAPQIDLAGCAPARRRSSAS